MCIGTASHKGSEDFTSGPNVRQLIIQEAQKCQIKDKTFQLLMKSNTIFFHPIHSELTTTSKYLDRDVTF